jgi:hypothetical protein
MMIQRALLLLASLALVLASRPASAVEIGIELEPGLGITAGSFPSGVPYTYDDADGSVTGYPSSTVNLLLDLKPTVAFSFAASLLINNFTIRTAVSVQKFSSVRLADLAIARLNGQDLPDPLPNIYLKNLLGFKGGEADITDSETMVLARVTLGYRFYLLEGRFRPYVPLGFGMAIVHIGGGGGTYYGPAAHLGFAAEYRLGERIDLGLAAQYEWMGFVLPENFQPSAAKGALAASVSSGRSAFSAFLKSAHTVQIGVTTTFRF